ncbi:MAG: M28 family metallopeptidase [bacterium]
MTGLRYWQVVAVGLGLPGLFCSCRQSPPDIATSPPSIVRAAPASLNGLAVIEQVRRFLEVGPRDAGTPGAGRAAGYLLGELQRLGIRAEIDEFKEVTPAGRKVFRNVIGRIGRSGGKIIVLGSHYDTKSGIGAKFQGANDSGSSTGLLLELAAVLKTVPPQETEIMFAFFDGEECNVSYSRNDGLHGSRRLAQMLVESGASGNVAGVIVLDMVGDRDLTICIPHNSTPGLCSAVFAAAHEEGVRSKFSQSRSEVLDDHVPFFNAGMPALDIIDFSYGSAPELNDYWHTEADTIDKLSAKSLEEVGRVTIRLLNNLLENKKGVAR